MASFLTRPVFTLLLVTISLAMAAPIPTKTRDISPEDEAEQIALDATEGLLADQKLVDQIKKDVKIIRSENPKVAKTINNGRKVLGKVEVEDSSTEALAKINASKFGPATSEPATDGTAVTVISFPKRYNPDVLTKELKKIGVSADSIWLTGPDYGDIEYSIKDKTYTFREGLENCKPNCRDNHFWVFKIENGKSELIGEHATDIPMPPRQRE